jgi:hypothetical protein
MRDIALLLLAGCCIGPFAVGVTAEPTPATVARIAGPATSANLLQNPGFEQLDAASMPAGWKREGNRLAPAVTTDAPHGGSRAARLTGDGQNVAYRQEVAGLPTRCYMASGWFRTNKLAIEKTVNPKDYARFYFHILYKDRPSADTTHTYLDIPSGTYGWTRLSVRLMPQTQWPIEKIRVTIAAQFNGGTLDVDDVVLTPAPLHAGALALEWENGLRPVVLADMGCCTPRSVLSSKAEAGRWKLIDYEAGGLVGRMAWAFWDAKTPPLTLPLGVRGWHAVFVGLADPGHLGCRALVRLTGDPAYVPRSQSGGQIEEAFFKVADLTGQSLHIAQDSGGLGHACGIAFVKLVPLTPGEVAHLQADRHRAAHRRLTATIDGFSYIYGRRPTSVETLLPEVETYRDTDFDSLVLQLGGADTVNYRSQVAEMAAQNLDVFPRPGDRFYAESLRELACKNINPTKVLIQGAQHAGLKVHVGIRPAAWVHSEPLSEFFTSRFYREHPEWRCVDRDGSPVARMSLAVPQVRSRLVEVLREAMGFGADGACILYNRGVPLVLFEKPFCELFQRRFHADPRQLSEDDARILQLRAELLTTFMRQIRTMLDDEARRRGTGKRLGLSAFVMADEADNVKYGIDLRTWAAQGLVEAVYPGTGIGGSSARQIDMQFFNAVCRAKGIRVRPVFIAWSTPDVGALVKRTLALYDAGADGMTIWDANSGADVTCRWSITSRLGHVDELREPVGSQPPAPVLVPIHKLGGMILDGRYRPNWGY